MALAKITFYKLIQDSQEYGSDDEYMVSRAFFNLEIEGKKYFDLYVDIKQTVGTNFETAPFEIGIPHGYSGPFNHVAFREEVENYYRSLIGLEGRGIHIEGGRNIRMRNNIFIQEKIVEFEVSSDPAGW